MTVLEGKGCPIEKNEYKPFLSVMRFRILFFIFFPQKPPYRLKAKKPILGAHFSLFLWIYWPFPKHPKCRQSLPHSLNYLQDNYYGRNSTYVGVCNRNVLAMKLFIKKIIIGILKPAVKQALDGQYYWPKNLAFVNVIDLVGNHDKKYWWDIKNSTFDQ